MTQAGKLGRMGEALFESWCAESDLTANKADNDDHGWDYIIEFPRALVADLSLGLDRQNIQCKVQVKATRQEKKTWQVELSNLYSMSTDSLPAFYLFIHYGAGNTPVAAYLLHVDEKVISKALKRVYENDAGDKKRLNKLKISLAYGKFRLRELGGKCMREQIDRYIGGDQSNYVKEKARILKAAGYDEKVAEIEFNMDYKALSDFIDASIGLEKQVEVQSLRGQDVRFGLKKEIPYFKQEKALMSVGNPAPYNGVLNIRYGDFSAALSFSAKLYVPPPILPLSSSLFKIRFDCGFFDLIVGGQKSAISFSINLGKVASFSVREVLALLTLIRTASNKGGKVSFSFDCEELQKRLDLYAVVGPESTLMIDDLYQHLSRFLSVFSSFELTQDVRLSAHEFDRAAAQAKELLLIIGGEPYWFKFEYKLSEKLVGDRHSAVVFLSGMTIGRQIFLAIAVAVGVPNSIDSSYYELATNNVEILEKVVLYKDDKEQLGEFSNLINKVISIYSKDYDVVSLIDESWLGK